ncbi:uncharacterized protein LOC124367985 [Homalodisca vitripennis]|uniref:uncharacterized protein LOC124367985 n=1 Tax=Homalodisca vitripennis TaxID=197043 RepID=UPI001EEC5F7A|nr:uncharacterized protein LOC124367985 [Homalodisca vitripennis]
MLPPPLPTFLCSSFSSQGLRFLSVGSCDSVVFTSSAKLFYEFYDFYGRRGGKLAGVEGEAGSTTRPRRDHPLARTRINTRDAEALTEVCCGEELPEVEIISLLQEQIPRYRLRADTLTQFTGYENQDWFIPSPAFKTGRFRRCSAHFGPNPRNSQLFPCPTPTSCPFSPHLILTLDLMSSTVSL